MTCLVCALQAVKRKAAKASAASRVRATPLSPECLGKGCLCSPATGLHVAPPVALCSYTHCPVWPHPFRVCCAPQALVMIISCSHHCRAYRTSMKHDCGGRAVGCEWPILVPNPIPDHGSDDILVVQCRQIAKLPRTTLLQRHLSRPACLGPL